MKIRYIGLSCFVLENAAGFRLTVDPFNDSPELSLGIRFPETLEGKPFSSNLTLMSESDADHARAPGPWLQKAKPTRPGEPAFPNLDLRGTVVYEWNGDLNIAYHYTLDGLRIAHFGDNAHLLSPAQLAEIGTPDIIFYPGSKVTPESEAGLNALQVMRDNLAALRPRLVIWTHQVVPDDLPAGHDPGVLRPYFQDFFAAHAATNQFYRGRESFVELGYVLETAAILHREIGGEERADPVIELGELPARETPRSLLFRRMLAQTT